MGPSSYRVLDADLPWLGSSPLGPRRLGVDDARAVMGAQDPVALALMLAYARSYAGALGGAVQGLAGAAALALVGRRRASGWALAVAAGSALAVIETRRRARQWEAVIETRLATLAGASAGEPA
ncbi:hypothetical protein QQX09_01755 [Demequina sp. SYSU T00192]|uniref:Uncharacterized protein n=1 Tax=Demequina litoralis TaxID=3051660 RepID=A0ABT8G604_9MICO|nr:hypothetical protein [Demequina sp. SYSU T00192]MDN4474571.1 hypothetical protein [Demequina sp. SYSU T00192]